MHVAALRRIRRTLFESAKLRDAEKFCPSANYTGERLQREAVRKLKLNAERC
jgi:hypothetical protein